MGMKQQIIVIGDIEMGAGNLTDDFISDASLAKVINELTLRKNPIDLVFNGDTFDFLKCPSEISPKTIYPRHITSTVSMEKLALIYKAHKTFFITLKNFLKQSNKKVYFVIGNHDHDLIYKEVQEELRDLLDGTKKNVVFPGIKYHKKGVYVEHGHMYDFLFKINFEKLFLKHKGETVLNFPFVTFGLISIAMHMKEKHPFIERIFPRPALMTHHRVVIRKLNRDTTKYFLKSLLYYPFRFYSDPTYSFPTGLVRE